MEFEAKKVVQELTSAAVGRAEERKLEKIEQKTKQLAAEKERRSGKKRKCPWSWLRIEARKIITDIVGEVEKQGRIRKGNVKKRELLSKLEEKRNEQEKKKEMELLGEIEKLGRLKKGQRMKRELLEKLERKKSEQDSVKEQPRANTQLLIMNLVGGNKNGSRKRKWSRRGGLWASWLGEGDNAKVHRVVRTGLRRITVQHMDITTYRLEESQEDQDMDTAITTESMSGANKEESLVVSMKDLMIDQGGMEEDDYEQMEVSLYQTPAKMKSKSPASTSKYWEIEENIWMTKVALTLGGRVLEEFLGIEEKLGTKG